MTNESLKELGILRQAGPRENRSLHAAQAIFDNIAEIQQLASEQGQLYQDDQAERYEWCRLVAMVIEVYMSGQWIEPTEADKHIADITD